MLGLRTMFNYYGGKWRLAPKYPAPLYKRIIEPFAGGAGYSLRYYQHNVSLYEIDERIYSLWKYLINVSAAEIRALPVGIIWHVDDLKGCCQEAKYLISYWISAAGGSGPRTQCASWYLHGTNSANGWWGEVIRERIASQVEQIRHWKVHNTSYESAPNNFATWFVDPPYNNAAGASYRHSNLDYRKLAAWCRRRNGQTLVCENSGADWLPFEEFVRSQAKPGNGGQNAGARWSHEALWTHHRPLKRRRRPNRPTTIN